MLKLVAREEVVTKLYALEEVVMRILARQLVQTERLSVRTEIQVKVVIAQVDGLVLLKVWQEVVVKQLTYVEIVVKQLTYAEALVKQLVKVFLMCGHFVVRVRAVVKPLIVRRRERTPQLSLLPMSSCLTQWQNLLHQLRHMPSPATHDLQHACLRRI